MGGFQEGTQGSSPLSGDARREFGVGGVRPSVVEALDTDLDAYLDRELFARPAAPTSAPERVSALEPETEAEPASEVPARALSVLKLAEEETEWLRQMPPPSVKAEPPPVEPLPVEVAAPPVAAWSAPSVAPPQPARDVPERSRRLAWLVAGALLGVLVVGALAAGMLWTGLRLGEAQASRVASVPVAAAPVAPVVEAPVAPPAPVVAAPPVSPAAASPVEVAPVQERTASTQGEQEARAESVEAPREAPAVAASAVTSVEPPEAPAPARAATEPKQGRVRPARVASAEPPEVLPVRATVSEELAPAPASEEAEAEPAKADGYAEFDEEYARELGFTDKPAPARPDPRASRSVYIPPAPGESLPERLTTADIMRVVVGHKEAIAGCIQEHRARTQPGAKGKLVARWSVLPDGSTEGAMVETAEYQGTPLAQCIEGLVKRWKFPRHRMAQQEPIRFPFTF